jgi:hypothetical protein
LPKNLLTVLELSSLATGLAMDAVLDEHGRLCYKRTMGGMELVLVVCDGPGCSVAPTSIVLIRDSSGGDLVV